MTIYSQRTPGYQNIKLGFGEGSLWMYGCKVVSFAQGLLKFNVIYTPPQMNQLLKDNNLFTGSTRNLMDDGNIHKLPFIESFRRVNTFTIDQLRELLKDHVVIGEVSPIPIGGSGQHFVCVVDTEGANAIIVDPWFGDKIKVATRYGKNGNILSLRVYKVQSNPGTMPETMQVLKKDWERLFKASTLGDRLINGLGLSGNIADRTDKQIDDLIANYKKMQTDLATEKDRNKGIQNEYGEFVREIVAKLKPNDRLPDITDRHYAIQLVEELVTSESNLQSSLKQKEDELDQKEKSWQAERDELKTSVSQLEREVNSVVEKYEAEIQMLKKRIEQLKKGIDDSNEDKQDINSIKAFIETIKRLIFRS